MEESDIRELIEAVGEALERLERLEAIQAFNVTVQKLNNE
jgi:hypothetical protein